MRKIVLTILALIFAFTAISYADKAESLQQAKEMSVRLNKPILMEFVHDD